MASATSELPLGSPELYINRELSQLEFNRRVLAQAKDDELPLLERLDASGEQYVSIIKAADGFATRFLNGPTLGRWLLRRSDAVLHDSTGMLPSVFSREAGLTADEWTVCTFGNLSSLITSHSRLNIDGTNLLTAQREGRFGGAELPMVYGYGKSTGRGIVLAAWRRRLAEFDWLRASLSGQRLVRPRLEPDTEQEEEIWRRSTTRSAVLYRR